MGIGIKHVKKIMIKIILLVDFCHGNIIVLQGNQDVNQVRKKKKKKKKKKRRIFFINNIFCII